MLLRRAALIVAIVLAAIGTAHADEPNRLPDAVPNVLPAPCHEPCGPPCEKTIRMRNIALVEKQNACTLPELRLREYEVGRDKRRTLEITYNETRQWCTELVLKPREIEQEVCCTEVKPVTTIDPCTGCPCTTYQPVQVTKRVKITVYDAVPEQKEYIVRTPCLKPVEEDVIIRKLAVDAVTIPAIGKRLEAIPTDCVLKVPVTVPPPMPCPCPK